MNDVLALFERWQLDVRAVREHMYRAPPPRERERWHALWRLAGPPFLKAARLLQLSSRAAVPPPALDAGQLAVLKAAGQDAPAAAGIDGRSHWNWRVVRRFVGQRFGRRLSQQLAELPASAGFRAQAAQEAPAEG